MKTFALLLLLLFAVPCSAGLIINGYDGDVSPTERIDLSCTTVDSFGECCEADWCSLAIYRSNHTSVAKYELSNFSPWGDADSCQWYVSYQAPSNYDRYVGWVRASGCGRTMEGIITFTVSHVNEYIDDIYGVTDSTWEWVRDSTATLAEIAEEVSDTMLTHANSYKADAGELAESLLAVQHLDDSTAVAVWAYGTKALTDKVGFQITESWESNIDAAISSRSSHNAAAIWSDATGTAVRDSVYAVIDSLQVRTDDLVFLKDSLQAVIDSLQLWDDNIAHLDEDISGLDDNPWNDAVRTLTAFDEDNVTIDLNGTFIGGIISTGVDTIAEAVDDSIGVGRALIYRQ